MSLCVHRIVVFTLAAFHLIHIRYMLTLKERLLYKFCNLQELVFQSL